MVCVSLVQTMEVLSQSKTKGKLKPSCYVERSFSSRCTVLECMFMVSHEDMKKVARQERIRYTGWTQLLYNLRDIIGSRTCERLFLSSYARAPGTHTYLNLMTTDAWFHDCHLLSFLPSQYHCSFVPPFPHSAFHCRYLQPDPDPECPLPAPAQAGKKKGNSIVKQQTTFIARSPACPHLSHPNPRVSRVFHACHSPVLFQPSVVGQWTSTGA